MARFSFKKAVKKAVKGVKRFTEAEKRAALRKKFPEVFKAIGPILAMHAKTPKIGDLDSTVRALNKLRLTNPALYKKKLAEQLSSAAAAVKKRSLEGGIQLSTPQWMKDIGDKIREPVKVIAAVAVGGILGKIIGGTRKSPTVAAGEASTAAQRAEPGVPDVGKVSTGAAMMLGGMRITPLMILIGAISLGIGIFFLKGR